MGARNNLTRVCRLKSTLGVMAELHQFITVFAAILSVVRQRFFGEALRETHGTHLDQRKIVIENAMAPFHLISTHPPPPLPLVWMRFLEGSLKTGVFVRRVHRKIHAHFMRGLKIYIYT